jgi:site-specific DNA recombinase
VTRRRRFIEYARVSKVGDRGDDLISPELQVGHLDAYAARDDIEIVDRVIDLDKTGRRFEKRAVCGIVARVRAREADGVLLYYWSRWGRNSLQSKIYIAEVEPAGGEVRAALEDFDPKTSMGKFTRDMLLSIAELQSNQISDGWLDVHRHRVAKGLTKGGAPPFGYRYAGKGRPFEVDPVTGPLVRKMYEDYLRGRGPPRMARDLNAAGVTTPRGKEFSNVTVQRVLDSGFAAGYLQVHPLDCTCDPDPVTGRRCGRLELVDGQHEPIVDEATWRRYLAERDRRRALPPKNRQPRWFLGGGLCVRAAGAARDW